MIYLIFTCIEQNELLLKFLEHYKEQGCDNAICLIEKDVSEEIVLKVFPKALIHTGTISLDARVRYYDDNWMRAKLDEDDWYINADVDEFTMHETKKLCDLIQETSHDHIRGRLVDRHTKDFHLPKILEENIWDQFPAQSQFTKEHGGWAPQGYVPKIVAAVKSVEIEVGHHGCKSNDFDKGLLLSVHHFKWWGNVFERLTKRNELSLPWNKELERELKTLWKLQVQNIKM